MTCAFCAEEAELMCCICGKQVCYEEHGRVFPESLDGTKPREEWCVFCLSAHNAAVKP